jgi:predicted nucleotidyltransferase component of viral defense system
MPLTPFQKRLAVLLAKNRGPDSHLAGGAALHFAPNTERLSDDLDYFHDSETRVAEAFASDRATLESEGVALEIEISQPGYIRAVVSEAEDATKIEWAHDSAWRFMPALEVEGAGFALHPVDLAVNKVLALAGRGEPRDYLDVLYADERILPLGALVWAAVGKDAGFTPMSLLELLKRRGNHRPEDFRRLRLVEPVDPAQLKARWLGALEAADAFIASRPADEIGCLYYDRKEERFTAPAANSEALPHYGKPGGILPRFYTGDPLRDSFRGSD